MSSEEQAEVTSHSSSQQSLTSYEDGDMVNFDLPTSLEPSFRSKSVDQLLEDAYDATKHVLGLTSKEEGEEVCASARLECAVTVVQWTL